MNFGESIAYWYLRLNGFIPMTNFVLHVPDEETGQNADADVLAVRFPYVFEGVGGNPDDWDEKRFTGWKLDVHNHILCVVCEVKTGVYKKADINRAFGKERLTYVLQRFGVIALDDVDKAVDDWLKVPVLSRGQISLAKLLVDDERFRPSTRAEKGLKQTPCLKLELHAAIGFIHARMAKYAYPKRASRMFFPGELIQFLAWGAGVSQTDDPTTSS